MDWLYDELDLLWRRWLPDSTSPTVRRGAFYSVLASPGFRIISLNMNYCNNKNWCLSFHRLTHQSPDVLMDPHGCYFSFFFFLFSFCCCCLNLEVVAAKQHGSCPGIAVAHLRAPKCRAERRKSPHPRSHPTGSQRLPQSLVAQLLPHRQQVRRSTLTRHFATPVTKSQSIGKLFLTSRSAVIHEYIY